MQRDRRVLDRRPVVQVADAAARTAREARCRQLLLRLAQHLLGRVDADEAGRRDRGAAAADREERVRGRAAEVVDRGAAHGEVGRQLADHPLDLGIERHRAIQHVVEDRGGIGVESEVFGAGPRFGEQPIESLRALPAGSCPAAWSTSMSGGPVFGTYRQPHDGTMKGPGPPELEVTRTRRVRRQRAASSVGRRQPRCSC